LSRNIRPRQFIFSFAWILCLLFAFSISTAFAQTPASVNYDPNKPIQIAADRMEADNNLHTVRFMGNVVVVQGDAVMNSDLIVVTYFAPKQQKAGDGSAGFLEKMPGTPGTTIEHIVATGRVKVVHKNQTATCGQAIYNHRKGTIILTGDPKLNQGTSTLAGKKIVMHLTTEKVEVVGGAGQRVSGQFIPAKAQAGLDEKAQKRLDDLKANPAPKPESEG
jgi:lipopolysaccharide export system protein LptA